MPIHSFKISFFARILDFNHADTVEVNERSVDSGRHSVKHASAGVWKVVPWWFWARLEFTQDTVRLCSILLSKRDAEEAAHLADAYRASGRFRPEIAQAADCVAKWDNLMARPLFAPHHAIEEWREAATASHAAVATALEALRRLDPTNQALRLSEILQNASRIAEKRNAEYVEAELERTKPWFESFSTPPTRIQREVAIRDETNSLIVAAAGTGKTSTILTKVRYLIHRGLAAPSDIVVVAFNHAAAEEIAEKCKALDCEAVEVRTFHALGLRILAAKPGEKPPVLSELSSEEGRDEVIAILLHSLCVTPEYAEAYARFLVMYIRPMVSQFEANSESDYVSKAKTALTRSLAGEWVRSTQELRIANWLHVHGVDYSYEAPYPHHLNTGFKRYQPDFTLRFKHKDRTGETTQRIVYLEHQALNERGEAPSWMKDYTRKVEFGRKVHRDHGTILVESFSWWFSSGVWETKLREALINVGVDVPRIDWQQALKRAEQAQPAALGFDRKMLHGLLRRALDLSRSSAEVDVRGQVLSGSPGAASRLVDARRWDLFQTLLTPLRTAYEEYKVKREGIDFEDMIFRAGGVLREGHFRARWTHYIVDEFQDASLSRLGLILALRQQTSGSRLTCVGDDWQAIIRFAGGDIRVMTQFGQRVGPFWRANLDRAFRYPETIAKLSTQFILRNPDQLKKTIQGTTQNYPVRVVLAGKNDEEGNFQDVIAEELERIQKLKPDASVMLLSRYRRGIADAEEQRRMQMQFPRLKLEWSTVHRSKGREADAVFVGDLSDSSFGFPCLREDDPLIRAYLPPQDAFAHAEERRLFYVATTRAKRYLVLIADASATSPFVTELIANNPIGDQLEVVRKGAPTKPCPRCNIGVVVARSGPHGVFFACTKSPVCQHKEDACPECRQGFMQRSKGRHVCSRVDLGCKHTQRSCPRCGDGRLEVRINRTKGNRFYGCSRFGDEEASCGFTQNI